MKILSRLSVIGLLLVGIVLGKVILPMLPCGVRPIASTNLAAMHHTAIPIASLIGICITDQATIWGAAGCAFATLSIALSTTFVAFVAFIPLLALPILPLLRTLPIITLPLVEILLAPQVGTLRPDSGAEARGRCVFRVLFLRRGWDWTF